VVRCVVKKWSVSITPFLLKFSQCRRQLLVEVRRGAGTCDDPCIIGRVLDSAFMQDRMRMSCGNNLIYTSHHTFRRHAPPPRAGADGADWISVRSPREIRFQKSSDQTLSSGLLREASPPGYATRLCFIHTCCASMHYFFVLSFLLFAFLCTRMTSNPLRESLRAGSFTVTPVLDTTRMRSQLSARGDGVWRLH